MADSRWNQFWGQLGALPDKLRPEQKYSLPIIGPSLALQDAAKWLNEAPPSAPVATPPPPAALDFGPAVGGPVAPAQPNYAAVSASPNSDFSETLDGIAQKFGGTVTSGKRSAAHNAEVGGVGNSYHLTGQARDLVPPKGTTMAAYASAIRAGMPGWDVINEGNHVHVEPGPQMKVPTPGVNSVWTFPTMQAPNMGGALAELDKVPLPSFTPLSTDTPTAVSPKLTPLDKAGVMKNFDGAVLPDLDLGQFAQLQDLRHRANKLNPLEGTVAGQLISLLTGGRNARTDANTFQAQMAAQLQRQVQQSGQKMDLGRVGASVDEKNNATVNQQAGNDATVAYQNALLHFQAIQAAAQAGNANSQAVFQALMNVQTAKAGLLAQQAQGSASAANMTAQGQQGLNMASVNAGIGPAAEAAGTASGTKAITRKAGEIAAASGIAPGDVNGTQTALALASGDSGRVINSVAKDLMEGGYAAVLLPPATYQALLATAMPKDAKGNPLPAAKVDQKALRLAAGQALAESMAHDPDSARTLIERAAKAGVPSAVAALSQLQPKAK